jgi:hypothetical protein
MKTDNVFKFVAVRAPGKVGPEEPVEEDDDILQDILKEILEALWDIIKNMVVPLHHARLILGRNLISSNQYYTNHSDWKPWLPFESRVSKMLKNTGNELKFDQFRFWAKEILEQIYGPDHNWMEFPKTDRFVSMKRSMLTSYYASVLDPYERPQDRENILLWVRFLYMMETVDDEERYERFARRISLMRPAVPFEFYKIEPEKEEPPKPETEVVDTNLEREKEIERIRDLITQLRKILTILKRVSAKKMTELRESQVKIPFGREQEFDEKIQGLHKTLDSMQGEINALKLAKIKEETSKEAIIPGELPTGTIPKMTSVGSDLIRKAAWRLTHQDIEENRDLVETLLELDLDPTNTTIPALIYQIQEKIAQLESQLSELTTQEEIVRVGRNFVRVRRPVRVSMPERKGQIK